MIPKLRCSIAVALCMLLSEGAMCQQPVRSVTLDSEITSVAIDRPGELYVVLRDGRVQRLDIDGKVHPLTEMRRNPTLFDPRDGSRLFAYYRDGQRHALFSPSREISSQAVDSAFAIDPWLVCPSGDYNLWIADAADGAIRKINTATSRVDAEIRFPYDVSAIRYMREYQGFLFVLHAARGIIVFSAMGRELRTLGTGAITYFNFLGEELYYPNGTELHFFNLFNAGTRIMKTPGQASFTLVTDVRIYQAGGKTVKIFDAAQ